MTDIKRNIKPFIFCLLSIALSAFCLYGFRSALLSDATSHLNISRYTFLNNIIDAVINFEYGIVKKCAVEENPKSEIDRYQAA